MKGTPRVTVLFITFVFFAVLIRLFYLLETSDSLTSRLVGYDSAVYQDRAREILAGQIAPKEAFRLSPLYPYILAAGFWLAGDQKPYLVRLWQAALGAVGCGLTFVLTMRLFGQKAGVTAGILHLLYGPLVFTESLVLLESAMCFLHLVFLLLLVAGLSRRSPALEFFAGVALGLTALLRGNVLLYIPAIVLFGLWRSKEARRALTMRFVLPLLLGASIPIVPCVVANYCAEGDLVLVPLV